MSKKAHLSVGEAVNSREVSARYLHLLDFFLSSRPRPRFCCPHPSSLPPRGNGVSGCILLAHRGSGAREALPLVFFASFAFLSLKKLLSIQVEAMNKMKRRRSPNWMKLDARSL